MKVHYLYERRECGCGDSMCSQCREVHEVVACGRRPPNDRALASRDVTKTTCGPCCNSQVYKDAQKAELARLTSGRGESMKDEIGELLTELVDEAFESPSLVGNEVAIESGSLFIISRTMMNRIIETRDKVLGRKA